MVQETVTVWNKRMLDFMKYSIDNGHSESQQSFLEEIGFPFTNLRQVKNGNQSFRHEHFHAACQKWKVNMNWFYGFEKDMFRQSKKQKPMEMLKAAVAALETEMKSSK